MAEYTFASIGKNGISVTPMTGASGALGVLYIKGTQTVTGVSPIPRVLTYNYENKLVYSGTDHSTRRGMNLAIFDQSMNLTFMATYDTYGDAASIKTLSDKLKTITTSQLAVLTSYDAIKSSAELDATMISFRCNSWPGTAYLTTTYRASFACIICGKKKAVIAEKFIGGAAPDPDAVIELAFNNPLTMGYEGFGKPLISDSTIHEDKTSDFVVKWLDGTLASYNLKIGDNFLFKSLGEIDDIAKTAKKNLEYIITYYNASGSIIRNNIYRVATVEGWEDVLIRDTIPDATIRILVAAKTVIDVGGSNQGSLYVKNTVMQLSDNTALQTSGVSIGLYGTSVKAYEDSLGGFGQYDPKGYYDAYQAESNILKRRTARISVDQPVNWFNMILDNPQERTVIKTSTSYEVAIGSVPVDPTKWYYLCVWANKKVKSAGQMKLGMSQLNSGSAIIPTSATDKSASGNRLYAQSPEFDMLETRQWYLFQGFILPHDVTAAEANKFIEDNKEFYGWDDLYGTGIGISDEGNGIYGWISNKDAKLLNVYFEDTDNNSQSETAWALPILRELKTGSIDIDDGLLTSINITG